MAKKSKLPEDPRDHYIYSENKISLKELSKLYRGKRGCSFSWLKKRCGSEGWEVLRTRYHAEKDQKTREKILEQTSEKKAKTLSQLNEEHSKRVQNLIKINEQILKQAMSQEIDQETGEIRTVIAMSPSDIRRITASIIDAQNAERLYHNFAPKSPIEDKADNSGDEDILLELFGDLLAEDDESDDGEETDE
jgi:hypothetical protein